MQIHHLGDLPQCQLLVIVKADYDPFRARHFLDVPAQGTPGKTHAHSHGAQVPDEWLRASDFLQNERDFFRPGKFESAPYQAAVPVQDLYLSGMIG